MQILVMFVFLAIWLLILWLGSIAFEATGMERRKARFQALSALTGTGFTTGEAESVVNDPRRRRIATWLILLGNTGILAFLIVLIQTVRVGLKRPSPLSIVVLVIVFSAVALLVWLGVVDRLSNAVVGLVRRGRRQPLLVTQEIVHQAGPYGVVRLAVGEGTGSTGISIGDIGFPEQGVAVLAIEREDAVLPLPAAEELLRSGDQLLCYGEVTKIIEMKV